MVDERGRRGARWCLRIAGILGILGGAAFGLFAIPAIVSVGSGRGIPLIWGFRTYGYGPLDAAGWPTTVPLLVVFMAACAVQIAGGVLLLFRLTAGIVVSLVGIAFCAVFWWGFVLPFGWAGGAVQIVLMALGWAGRRSRDDDRAAAAITPP